jgi:hypothetical protein
MDGNITSAIHWTHSKTVYMPFFSFLLSVSYKVSTQSRLAYFLLGFCHACKNQGMDALKHPAVPIGYETGQADTGCPFFDDDSDDDGDRVPDDDGMACAFSQAFLGGAPY